MVFEALPSQRHEVQILTVNFQFSGQLETVGNLAVFINDAVRDSLSLYDAHLTPLTPGSPMKGFQRPHVVVRRPQVVFLHFASAETRTSFQTRQNKEFLVAYTPVAVCRGYFHMSAEARVRDFVDAVQEQLIPVTEARIFPLVELPAPFPAETEMIMIGRSQLQSYHPA
ncbi:MAG: hypothetical protein JW918_04915 [Anaerolineae bacterium]|nr:hypothetical protein [Anaerolineae bacterium]